MRIKVAFTKNVNLTILHITPYLLIFSNFHFLFHRYSVEKYKKETCISLTLDQIWFLQNNVLTKTHVDKRIRNLNQILCMNYKQPKISLLHENLCSIDQPTNSSSMRIRGKTSVVKGR